MGDKACTCINSSSRVLLAHLQAALVCTCIMSVTPCIMSVTRVFKSNKLSVMSYESLL